ncbi:MAG: HAD family phosphatase [Muribaculaceae bacterium]|nr:HAD family phosphatase [Muribaculaceae bacterium]
MGNNQLQNIENIIFDLGGVVIDLDRDRAVAALTKLGLKEADEMLGLYRQEEPFLGLETGRVTAGEFFDLLREKCPGATDTLLTDAFNQFLVRIPVERLEMLRRLRMAGYRIFVLSNTNPVMYNSWIANAFRAEGGSINDYFDGIVASFQELTCKPDPAIFSTVARRYGLNPAATLMLDDSDANCRSAAGVGMHALRVGSTPGDDMLAICHLLLRSRGLE